MARVRILLAAEADIEHALVHTLSTFGVQKFEDYASLIQEALDTLAADPQAGRRRHDIDAKAWTYHIGKRGRRARHLFMYRIVDGETLQCWRSLTTPWISHAAGELGPVRAEAARV